MGMTKKQTRQLRRIVNREARLVSRRSTTSAHEARRRMWEAIYPRATWRVVELDDYEVVAYRRAL